MPIRAPEYESTTSEGGWSRPTFQDYVSGYFRHSDAEEEDIAAVSEAPQALREWAASLTFAGDPEADTFEGLVVLPAVDPETMALHEDGLEAVLSRAPQTDGISNDDAEEIQDIARMLLEDEFGRDLSSILLSVTEKAPTVLTGMEMIGLPVGTKSGPTYATAKTGVVKGIDVSTRTVMGYYASFGNVDADGDEFQPGAFSETIAKRGPDGEDRIRHLWQHNMGQPIGTPQVLREDSNGLYFETQIVDTTIGKDALKLYEAGVVNEHSVGFNRLDSEPRDDGSTLITRVKLWEGSTVTWGANKETPATGMKESELVERADSMRTALRKGLSDPTTEQVERTLKSIESHLEKEQKTVNVLQGLGAPPKKTVTIP